MSAKSGWTEADIPDQKGRVILVTGANSGIGLEAAKGLAKAGARVLLACRDEEKAREAARGIEGDTEVLRLDLANLSSIREAAASVLERHPRLDVLVNNAGVMAIPRRTTADGFEMQLGTNHLGHFALTGILLERLAETKGSRVVNVSSQAHRQGRIRFDDLQSEQAYSRWGAYGQSKLANLLFTYELERRRKVAGREHPIAVGCHPGYASTNLQFVAPQMDGSRLFESGMALANRLFSQDARMGALPTLYAATAPEVQGGDYVGPDGFYEMWGHPKRVESTRRSKDPESARRLWEISESLTNVRYAWGAARAEAS